MKILHVITSLQIGGAEKLVTDIVPMLREKGHEVDVCLFDGQDTTFKRKLQTCGCKIFSFSNGGNVYNPLNILRIARLMRHYDIVHTHNTAPQFFAALASKFSTMPKLVTTEHNTSNRRRAWKWYPTGIDRWMYNQHKYVICISDQAEENLISFITNTKAKVKTIYNGVDVETIHSARPNHELLCQKKRFTITMVAGFRFQKDQDTLIRAMNHLSKDEYELWLVGDGERREEIEQLIRTEGLQDNVKLFGLRSDIPNILKATDVVCMSSHWEGMSLSNIEGMAAGKPFIASDVDGLREVTDGYGLLFPHGDEQLLAETIKRLHDDRQLYDHIAERCYERACQFDITTMVEKYNQLYLEIVKEYR